MFWNKPKLDPAAKAHFPPHGLTAIEDLTRKLAPLAATEPPPTTLIQEVFGEEAARAKISPVSVQEPPPVEGRYTVDFHIKNMESILNSFISQRASILETGDLDREDYERRVAERARQVAECDRMIESYSGALKIANPPENTATVAVEKPATRRKPAQPKEAPNV